MSDYAFALSKQRIVHGKAVFRVSNVGEVVHDFKIAGKKTPIFTNGQSGVLGVAFKKPGKYPFVCTVPGHIAAGMKGVLTVRQRSSASVPPGPGEGRRTAPGRPRASREREHEYDERDAHSGKSGSPRRTKRLLANARAAGSIPIVRADGRLSRRPSDHTTQLWRSAPVGSSSSCRWWLTFLSGRPIRSRRPRLPR
jgi:hypothetical protein